MNEEVLERVAQKEATKKRKLLNKENDPPAKRKPPIKIPSREIPFDKHNLPRLKELMGVSPFYHPPTGKKGIFCSIGMEPQFFFTFPLIYEGKPPKKYNISGCKYLAGLSQPAYVFSVLTKLFHEIHGSDPELHIMDWELWKINQAFYGKGKSQGVVWNHLLSQALCTRPLGGYKNPAMIRVTSWLNIRNRLACSVPISECFNDGQSFTMDDLKSMDKAIRKQEKIILKRDLQSLDSDVKHAFDVEDLDSSSDDNE